MRRLLRPAGMFSGVFTMSNVVIIGSGGREHALAWKIAQNNNVDKVYFTGANAGMEMDGFSPLALSFSPDNYKDFARQLRNKGIDAVVVGPEQPLVDGIADILSSEGFRTFGPSKEASALEADKFFSYWINNDIGIPQAAGVRCFTPDKGSSASSVITKALAHWEYGDGVVFKARGLHAGKGVVVYDSLKDARDGMEEFVAKFGSDVLLSQKLVGEEFSAFAMTDGEHVVPLPIAFKDHKRAYDNDQGKNTGGMGAFGPTTTADPVIMEYMKKVVFSPLIKRMKQDGMPFTGFLYAGMMMTEGGPKVLEYNVRMGDPETQPAMMLIEDLFRPIDSLLNGKNATVKVRPGYAACVVLAAKGYPDSYDKGFEIHGLDALGYLPNSKVFHAGTKPEGGRIISNGGRVLGVTTYSRESLCSTLDAADIGVKHIADQNPGRFHYRTDIGAKER